MIWTRLQRLRVVKVVWLVIVMDCQSGYSYHQQDKQILGGCLRNREGQAAVKIVSSVWWRKVLTEKM